jgi:endonuclease YncB( thermonuclease family)
MRRSPINFAGTKRANYIAVGRKHRTRCLISLTVAPVECVEVDRDRYKRAVSVCTVASTDIADWLVRKGLALDWPQYSKGGYADAQAEAKREQRGMWGGSFKEPWNYRACRRSGGRPESCSDE